MTLCDAWGPGNSRASSGGETRIIRATYGPDRPYVQMAVRALEIWKEHEKRWNLKLFHHTGVIWLAGADDKYEKAALPLLRDAGVRFEEMTPAAAAKRFPQMNFDGVKWAIHEQDFGFLTAREKDAFLLLLTVSGIGPKLALSVISTLSVDDLSGAILNDDYAVLASVPGIGKKSAGRLALELKDKIEKISFGADILTTKPREPSDRLMNDGLSALVNLGYKAADVKDVLKQVLAARNGEMPLQDLIRAALKELAK